MKKLLLIATGGTIASVYTPNGLAPQLRPEELLSYVPEAEEFCAVECVQPFAIDSTNMAPEHWLRLAGIVEEAYERYDGFVICHGTDTMAYTAAALSYLIQNSPKPIVVTGAQKPINLPTTDARTNLCDSLRFAAHERSHGVCIVFGGQVIAGTRAKKEYSKSYNAFSSINYPAVALILDGRIVFYIDDKRPGERPVFYHDLNRNIFLFKLTPGADGEVLRRLLGSYDAVIIESFGVGGLPDSGEGSFYRAVKDGLREGKIIVLATQVTHEGSDMSIYEVGKVLRDSVHLIEAYDMTLEATVAKTMWALPLSRDYEEFRTLFCRTVNHDMLLQST